MALIKCPECGREISDAAAACPACGYPIAEVAPSNEPTPAPTAESEPGTRLVPVPPLTLSLRDNGFKRRIANIRSLMARRRSAAVAIIVAAAALAVFVGVEIYHHTDHYRVAVIDKAYEDLNSAYNTTEGVGELVYNVLDDVANRDYNSVTVKFVRTITAEGKDKGRIQWHTADEAMEKLYSDDDFLARIRSAQDDLVAAKRLVDRVNRISDDDDVLEALDCKLLNIAYACTEELCEHDAERPVIEALEEFGECTDVYKTFRSLAAVQAEGALKAYFSAAENDQAD